ncbi:MAG: hypothetical protein M1823_004109 [Watsoniomyces obsoletus]|nr:MAG: hypothetical protein M1823_004109 [Watsoniomyces obsoletus]
MPSTLRKRPAKSPEPGKPNSTTSKLQTKTKASKPSKSASKTLKSEPAKSEPESSEDRPVKKQKTFKTSFLDLPSEIRNMIYDLVFQVPEFVIPVVTGPIKPERSWTPPVTNNLLTEPLDFWPSCVREGGYACEGMRWERQTCGVHGDEPPAAPDAGVPARHELVVPVDLDVRPYHLHRSDDGVVLSAWRPGKLGMASLLSTCRQIRMDTIGLLYSNTTFSFNDVHHLLHFLLTIGDPAKEHITSVHFRMHQIPSDDDQALAILTKMRNLKCISFGVERETWGVGGCFRRWDVPIALPVLLGPASDHREYLIHDADGVSAMEMELPEGTPWGPTVYKTLPPGVHLLRAYSPEQWRYVRTQYLFQRRNLYVKLTKHDDSKTWPGDIINRVRFNRNGLNIP